MVQRLAGRRQGVCHPPAAVSNATDVAVVGKSITTGEVYFAGLAFTLRDFLQERLGRLWTVAAIVIGAALSALVSPQFALASGVAFLLSELADFAVYTPLRRRSWGVAIVASNLVGLTIDSALFL